MYKSHKARAVFKSRQTRKVLLQHSQIRYLWSFFFHLYHFEMRASLKTNNGQPLHPVVPEETYSFPLSAWASVSDQPQQTIKTLQILGNSKAAFWLLNHSFVADTSSASQSCATILAVVQDIRYICISIVDKYLVLLLEL